MLEGNSLSELRQLFHQTIQSATQHLQSLPEELDDISFNLNIAVQTAREKSSEATKNWWVLVVLTAGSLPSLEAIPEGWEEIHIILTITILSLLAGSFFYQLRNILRPLDDLKDIEEIENRVNNIEDLVEQIEKSF